MDLIEEVLAFTRGTYKTYMDAPPFMKRHYLRFFYEKLIVKNQLVLTVVPTPFFRTLLENKAVILRLAKLRDLPSMRIFGHIAPFEFWMTSKT